MASSDLAGVVQVARLPFQAGDGGANPTPRLHFDTCTSSEAATLLATSHYLGPLASARYGVAGWVDDVMVACQLWRHATARMIEGDPLELSRWCLTPAAGKNAGSKMMGWARRNVLRPNGVTVCVSYSDLTRHTGALYRSSGWTQWPTHHADRFLANGVGYPSGHGKWSSDGEVETPKMRWRYEP